MSKPYILFAMIAAISLFAFAAYKYQNNESRISSLIDASKITEIKVTLLDIHSREDKVFKTISTPTEIGNLCRANATIRQKSAGPDLDKENR